MVTMSISHAGTVPEVTLGWRMKIALGDRSIQEMCDLLGVHRATIGRWIADKGAPPKIAYLRQWALATGVNYEWLCGMVNGMQVRVSTRIMPAQAPPACSGACGCRS